MASNTCMNSLCGASTSIEWKKGWTLRSGECVNLCDKCGSAYEQLNFCDMFHSKDSGWRECTSCGKRLHCGCIASRFLLELLDGGGVKCICCVKSSKLHPVRSDGKPNGFGTSAIDDADELQTSSADNQADAVSIEKMKLLQFHNISDGNGLKHLLQSQNGDAKRSSQEMKKEELMAHPVEIENPCVSDANKPVTGSSRTAKPYICKSNAGVKRRYEPLTQTNLSFSLGDPSGNPNSFPGVVVDEREQSDTTAPFLQGPRSDHLFPKPPKLALATGLETNAQIIPQVHVARPSAGARNQLLPRYWPRITEQELQQISGDSNSTIVPLFEKVLSASDAGRIGRLVLPKACAEAYFPPISQPEGLPLRIQDVKGKEWVFQFRFWPNNNSRMYVLEGVTPCIQSMQLQAGDTVIFSRMDPEGKLIMGFRKASNSVNMQLLKGSTGPQINAFSKHYDSACSWITPEKNGGRTRDCLLLQTMVIPERKKTRNIGSRSKRLLIDTQEALELKLTWEEVQDMLRTPPSLTPSVVTVEDHEFEEFEEPPVFGKMSIFIVRTSGGQEQWAHCDSCFKWRKLPVHILLPPKWTCAENCWDPCRCSCSAPDELNSRELENLLILHKDFKRRRIATSNGLTQEHESLGVDALANATILEDEPGTTSVATTTKHPRHRPGCSCIVCIQPPSGKGKHKPTCTCNVCMAVKRRFKTLMTRKKKRQSEAEREVQIAQKNHYIWSPKDESMLHHDPSDDEGRLANELEPTSRSNFSANKLGENSKWSIDLNFQPDRGEDLQVGLPRVSMMSLLQIASLPLETYMKQNGLTSLIPEQLASSGSHSNWNSERRLSEDRCLPSMVQEQDSSGGEDCGPEQSQTDPL